MSFGRLLPMFAAALVALVPAAPIPAARADEPAKIVLTLKDHRFSPAEAAAPASKPIVIELMNQDGTPAEFESKSMRFEKAVPGGKSITVNVHPLKPGRYPFFDEYNEETAQGVLVVQ